MIIADICDEIRPLLEPNASLRDDTLARPRGVPGKLVPGITYLWLRRETFGPDGQGQIDRRSFYLRMAWVEDYAATLAAADDPRDVSLALAQRSETVRSVVAAHRAGTSYEWLQVDQADYESLAAIEVRGVYIDLSGWVGPGHG